MIINPSVEFTLGEELTQDQVTYFDQNGYLHFHDFVHKDAINSILKAIKEVEANWLEQRTTVVNGVPLKFGRDLDGTAIIQRFAFASQFHPVLHELLKDTRFKALLPLLGGGGRIGENEKDGMVINHYVNSQHSKFTQMGWHTDGLRDVFYGHHVLPMLNVGLHLNDYPADFGGLRVIPGTHRQGLFDMLFRKTYFRDNRPDPLEVAFDIKAGDLTIHDGRLWHRVAKSTVAGEASRRRVIYVPFITGKYSPKNTGSKTPIYFKFQHLAKY